jgi:hypothetical protein
MIDGKLQEDLTPLNDVQKRILELMKVPLEAITGSCLDSQKPIFTRAKRE